MAENDTTHALARLSARQQRELEEIERQAAAGVPLGVAMVTRAMDLRAMLVGVRG